MLMLQLHIPKSIAQKTFHEKKRTSPRTTTNCRVLVRLGRLRLGPVSDRARTIDSQLGPVS